MTKEKTIEEFCEECFNKFQKTILGEAYSKKLELNSLKLLFKQGFIDGSKYVFKKLQTK